MNNNNIIIRDNLETVLNRNPENVRMAIKEIYQGMRELYGNGFAKMYLFGSRARGDFDEYSDIDLFLLTTYDKEKIKELEFIGNSIVSKIDLNYLTLTMVLEENLEHFEEWKNHKGLYKNILLEGVELNG